MDAVKGAKKVAGNASAVKNRVKLRKAVYQQVLKNSRKTPDGDFLDPYTNKVVPKDGPFDIGHKRGESWMKRKMDHIEKGSTRKEVIEAENNPDLYHVQDPSSNRSRRYD